MEVKTRISGKFGLPEEAISYAKQKRLVRAVFWFLYKYPEYQTWQLRIDVCAILLSEAASVNARRDLDKFIKYSKIITNAVELN